MGWFTYRGYEHTRRGGCWYPAGIAEAIYIEGLSREPVSSISIAPGTSLRELVERFGGTIRTEWRPDPTPLQRKAKRAAEVGERVSLLLREYDRWEDLPAPTHMAGDPCVECDARRIADDTLD